MTQDLPISSDALAQHAQALREQAVILDTAGVGIVFIKQRTIIRCNQRFADIYGHRQPSDLVGQRSQTLYPDDAAAHALGAAAYPAMAQGWAYKTEILMKRHDGQIFWAHLTGKLVNPDATDEGSIWIIDDIHEQRLAQSQLQATLNEQNLILDNALVGIVFLRGRKVSRCNRKFEEIFGYGPGELQHMSSRLWYLSEADWLAAGQRCYAPLAAGLTFDEEMRLSRKDGSAFDCAVSAKAIDTSHPEDGSIWITMDITARKQAQRELMQAHENLERLVAQRTQELSQTVAALKQKAAQEQQARAHIERLAHFDALTHLPNRSLLADRCHVALSSAQRNGQTAALMFMDLDHFKNINDALGHNVGDQVLVELAQRLGQEVREQDTVSRLGGDEFILLLPDTDASGAVRVAEKILHTALQPFQIEEHELTVTPSIGIALYPKDGTDLDSLSQAADAAMYRAKSEGRNSYCFFTRALRAESDRTLLIDNALRRALERNQLYLHYQPQFSLMSGALVGAEALLRWTHPELGAVSPAEFIPIAERNGLILTIGEWVLRTATTQLAQWLAKGFTPITMAVNLSAVQFRHADLPATISNLLAQAGLAPQWLELELTEGVAMTHPQKAIATMNDLHQRGIRMSIDDFGTGYSSLSYLKKFQVYKLKIDQSFVRDISTDPDDRAIVSAIISMSTNLGLQTIAEGVETESQLAFLREQGCQEVQGYYFSRPLSAAAFEAEWAQNTRSSRL
ncbi:bifunctional diguanylate cyclase/phosphodiesterase [Rhodoferax sp.]|uniref:sensor domain-containing protein n=1 Tax=Rhodoferax sp. TaxID=50421 RepID=UPI00263188D5|nr:bifunctional diguanylate cyclase/phosphodiesterase [Rhodoferax sp.]MDD2809481.1 EAL domain-containing protein [Rhodoferax sp.]MDD4944126.1 EAL domain-containing protein [Rhodoferax sp.]